MRPLIQNFIWVLVLSETHNAGWPINSCIDCLLDDQLREEIFCFLLSSETPKLIIWLFLYIMYNRLFMRPRNLCILAKNGNLWILFMRGSTWGKAIFTVDITLCDLYLCLIRIIAFMLG